MSVLPQPLLCILSYVNNRSYFVLNVVMKAVEISHPMYNAFLSRKEQCATDCLNADTIYLVNK